MKRRLHAALFALVIVLAVLSSGVSAEDGYDAVVLATGTDEANCERSDLPGVFVTQDVCRVQEAVSANPGGKILLKGTFHFAEYGDDGYVVPGTDGTVFITNDVEISGEKDGDRFLTRILGGYFTFSVGYQPVEWSYDVDPDENYSPGDNISPAQAIVRDISFENSLYTAIRVWSTTGTIVEGNRFLGGRSYEGGAYCTGPQCSGYAYAISVMQPDALQRLRPQVYTGDLYIIDNVIDCDYGRADADDPWGKPAYGIPVRGYSYGVLIYEHRDSIGYRVTDNQITNCGFAGIWTDWTKGDVEISGNTMVLESADTEIQPSPMGIRTPHTLIQSLTDGSDLEAANDIDMGEHPSAEPVYRPLYVLRPALVKPVSFGLLLLIGLVAVLVLRGSQSTGENSVADGEQED